MLIPKNKYTLFNKVILASISQWTKTHQDKNDGVVPDILLQVSTKGFNMKAVTGFTDEEVKLLNKIETDPVFMGIKAKEISYLVHALMVLKYWIEDVPKNQRPYLNISDDKMIKGKATYWRHMMLAKKLDPELYESEKIIIDETLDAAQKWYSYFKEQLLPPAEGHSDYNSAIIRKLIKDNSSLQIEISEETQKLLNEKAQTGKLR